MFSLSFKKKEAQELLFRSCGVHSFSTIETEGKQKNKTENNNA